MSRQPRLPDVLTMRRRQVLAAAWLVVIAACSNPSSDPTSSSTNATTPRPNPTTTTLATAGPTNSATGFRVLVFHETAGFRHDSIPAGIDAMAGLGKSHDFEVTVGDDSSVFLDPELEDHDVVVFLNTTGDVLEDAEEAAMEEFIRSGRGFVGIHSATDTEYDWAWYGGLVGAYFSDHPAVQSATLRSAGADHPAAAGLPARFERVDEWYNFRNPPGPGVVVLATLDESTYQGGTMGDNHPIAWAHEFDGGRSFYTAGGHTMESYTEPLFLQHLAAGILWAAGGR